MQDPIKADLFKMVKEEHCSSLFLMIMISDAAILNCLSASEITLLLSRSLKVFSNQRTFYLLVKEPSYSALEYTVRANSVGASCAGDIITLFVKFTIWLTL